MPRHALRLLLALCLTLAPAVGLAEVFRWVDELGVTHYTTDPDTIPRRFRDSATEIVEKPTRSSAGRVAPLSPRRAPTQTAAPLPDAPSPPAPAPAPSAAPSFPGPARVPELPAGDPRSAEVAELEAQIASDRESLRVLISTRRWDSAELASDPSVREIAERLPRLQAQLEALRAEIVP